MPGSFNCGVYCGLCQFKHGLKGSVDPNPEYFALEYSDTALWSLRTRLERRTHFTQDKGAQNPFVLFEKMKS